MNSQHDSGEERLLLSVLDAAKKMSISARTLFSLTKSGEIPHVRLGRRVMYRPEALKTWVAQREQRGTSTLS